METVILFGLQMAALLGYIWIEFAEIRSLIKKAENNIITAIVKNEISNESTTDNK
jgi:hypothetical protein